MLVAGSGAVMKAHLKETEVAARSLSMQLQLLHVQEPEGLENAFRIARQGSAEVLSVVATNFMNSQQ